MNPELTKLAHPEIVELQLKHPETLLAYPWIAVVFWGTYSTHSENGVVFGAALPGIGVGSEEMRVAFEVSTYSEIAAVLGGTYSTHSEIGVVFVAA